MTRATTGLSVSPAAESGTAARVAYWAPNTCSSGRAAMTTTGKPATPPSRHVRSVNRSLPARPPGSAEFAAYSAVVKWKDSMTAMPTTV